AIAAAAGLGAGLRRRLHAVLLLALLALLLKLAVLAAAVAVLENLMARARFIKAPALSWLALGAALLAFVFYLARV
ncbi:MAG: hypothetical protein ACKOC5_08440, partial [Chloroflexota bacterium]